MARNHAMAERERLMVSLSDSLPREGGAYEVSSAFMEQERKRFIGAWLVEEHSIEGRPWLASFIESSLKGAELREARCEEKYEFGESICVKRVSVEGLLELEEGLCPYLWRLCVALDWEPGKAFLRVRPTLGYQLTMLDGKPAAVRELPTQSAAMDIECRFEDGFLVLEEGGDRKVLSRGRA